MNQHADEGLAHTEHVLRRLASHNGLVAWLLEDLLDEIYAGEDVSDLVPLLRGAGAPVAAAMLERHAEAGLGGLPPGIQDPQSPPSLETSCTT